MPCYRAAALLSKMIHYLRVTYLTQYAYIHNIYNHPIVLQIKSVYKTVEEEDSLKLLQQISQNKNIRTFYHIDFTTYSFLFLTPAGGPNPMRPCEALLIHYLAKPNLK